MNALILVVLLAIVDPGKLVEDLGSTVFTVREGAKLSLREAGDNAWEALEKGSKSTDPEIRYDCQEILDDYYDVCRQSDSLCIYCLPGGRMRRRIAAHYYGIAYRDLYSVNYNLDEGAVDRVGDAENLASCYYFYHIMHVDGATRTQALKIKAEMQFNRPISKRGVK